MITEITDKQTRDMVTEIMQADGTPGKHWFPYPTHYFSDDGTLGTIRGAFSTMYAPLAMVWISEASKSFAQGLFFVRHYRQMEAIIEAEVKRRNPDAGDVPTLLIVEPDSPVVPYLSYVNYLHLTANAYSNMKGTPYERNV